MTFLKSQHENFTRAAEGRRPPRSMVETLFYAAGLALMAMTMFAIAVIVCGILYFLIDVLILHRTSFHPDGMDL